MRKQKYKYFVNKHQPKNKPEECHTEQSSQRYEEISLSVKVKALPKY